MTKCFILFLLICLSVPVVYSQEWTKKDSLNLSRVLKEEGEIKLNPEAVKQIDFGSDIMGTPLMSTEKNFILQGSNALGAIGTTWAMIGIGNASKSLKQAICRLYQRQHFAIPAIEFLLRMTLALILLFHPFEKFSTHIIILGLELIAVSIRLPQSLPFGNNSKDKETQ